MVKAGRPQPRLPSTIMDTKATRRKEQSEKKIPKELETDVGECNLAVSTSERI